MSRRQKQRQPGSGRPIAGPSVRAGVHVELVESLMDQMTDGKEFADIVGTGPKGAFDANAEIRNALGSIQTIRQRPCIAYVGNPINGLAESAITPQDDLPFSEMVGTVPKHEADVDVLLSTPGGSAPQVARFVNCLRDRFRSVEFLLPSFCMSAGTLFALSGDRIWMNPGASLGPIDPQSPNQNGQYVPSQALLLLVQKLQKDGQAALAAGSPVPWTAVRLIDTLDKKDLGAAITASNYAQTLATEFLVNYKFKHWVVREGSGESVTEEYRRVRAMEIAAHLASHEKWQSHGHAIARQVLWEQIKLRADHPAPDLERALRRAWALLSWLFDKTPLQKVMVSDHYSFYRATNREQPK